MGKQAEYSTINFINGSSNNSFYQFKLSNNDVMGCAEIIKTFLLNQNDSDSLQNTLNCINSNDQSTFNSFIQQILVPIFYPSNEGINYYVIDNSNEHTVVLYTNSNVICMLSTKYYNQNYMTYLKYKQLTNIIFA